MTDNKERTFIMVKPDGVQRGLVGKIIQRFEDKGFKLVALKMVEVSFTRVSPPSTFLIFIHNCSTRGLLILTFLSFISIYKKFHQASLLSKTFHEIVELFMKCRNDTRVISILL